MSFFFSSRRRHTRYWRDWSSDVCSSRSQSPAGTPNTVFFNSWAQKINEAAKGAVRVEVRDGETLSNFMTSYDRVADRSEEHTSELQSRQYLVCRLLLEKKKKNHMTSSIN